MGKYTIRVCHFGNLTWAIHGSAPAVGISIVHPAVVLLGRPFDSQPLATDFNIKWTPTLITLDVNGKEHHRTVGFLPPEELIASLVLGMAKTEFDNEQFEGALKHLDMLLQQYPQSDAAPEAIFLRGVCGY